MPLELLSAYPDEIMPPPAQAQAIAVIVASAVDLGDGRVRCAAAPMLAGSLARAGLAVVSGGLSVRPHVDVNADADDAGRGRVDCVLVRDPSETASGQRPRLALGFGRGQQDIGSLSTRLRACLLIDEWSLAMRSREIVLASSPSHTRCLRAAQSAHRALHVADSTRSTVRRDHVATRPGVLLLLGAPGCEDSARLARVSERAGTPAYLIEDPSEVRPEWIAEADQVGVAACGCVPAMLSAELVSALGGLGPVKARECSCATGSVRLASAHAPKPPEPSMELMRLEGGLSAA